MDHDDLEEMLLELLVDAGESSVPGELLSGKLGIEPSDVYRRVNGLRGRGYRIDTLRAGYRLVEIPDRVGYLELSTCLATRELGRTLHYREEVPSTNEVALQMAREGAFHGDVIVAEHQTMGRGRRGRRWLSLPRKNLCFSVVLKPDVPLNRAPELTFVGAVALARAVALATGLEAGIKWPNDLYLRGRKAAGLLPEVLSERGRVSSAVLGFGLNVNMAEHELPPEIATRATSLRMELGRSLSRPSLLAAILSSIEEWYDLWVDEGFGPVREEWLAMNITLGHEVRVVGNAGNELVGEAVGIDTDGSLLLRLADGTEEKVHSGDVLLTREAVLDVD